MKFFAFIILFGTFSYLGQAQEPAQTASAKPGKSAKKATGTSRSTVSDQPDEKASWEKILALTDPSTRANAARGFLEAFPNSPFHAQAADLVIRSMIEEGHLRLRAEDLEAAAARFIEASTAAASPLDEKLFAESLSKLPGHLYFGGAREQSFRLAEVLEAKIQNNADQMLSLANFYLSVEQGSKALSLAEAAIKIKPDSAAAYQTLGLASRMDFQIEQSAAAYEKALQIDPDSDTARRGLAEMKRALGKADEAAQLFGVILSKDPTNLPARTGLILSMFDAGKRDEAETELAKFLVEHPRNVLLLAGTAYWHSTHENGEKAVEFAQRAIDADPRFIWSHISLARGLLLLGKPHDAEKTLLAARRYGNFPTLEYEIASTRLRAGFFKDAADEIGKSFTISDGLVRTSLGGRISRTSKEFEELVALERRASIFAPNGLGAKDIDQKLFFLLEIKQIFDSPKPDVESALKAIDQFVQGNDTMKVHRQLYAAGLLLDRKLALERAAEIAQAATTYVDAGLDNPLAASATLASELYEGRSISVARGEYLNVPDVPRTTLSAIVRGRIEEIIGWAKFQMGEPAAAAIRLKRAVNVLPAKSAWSQSASWRLGSALALNGKEAEALDVFIRTYKESGLTDGFRYETIATLYRKVHGNIDDLQTVIGPDPRQPAAESNVTSTDTLETNQKVKEDASIEKPLLSPNPDPAPLRLDEPTPTPSPKAEASPVDNIVDSRPPKSDLVGAPERKSGTTLSTPLGSKGAAGRTGSEKDIKELFPPIVITIPLPQGKSIAVNKTIPYLPNPMLNKDRNETSETIANVTPSSVTSSAGESRSGDRSSKPADHTVVSAQSKDSALHAIKSCTLTASEDSITILSDGGGRALIVGIDDETDLEGIKGISLSPEHISVRREPIAGISTRALFVIKSESTRPGVYQVNFELPCGKKLIVVNVR